MAIFIYEPFIQAFTDVSTVTVSHNFGRKVLTTVFVTGDETGDENEEVICDVKEDPTDPLNKIIVEFTESVSGEVRIG